jgi:hypothetical protein
MAKDFSILLKRNATKQKHDTDSKQTYTSLAFGEMDTNFAIFMAVNRKQYAAKKSSNSGHRKRHDRCISATKLFQR